MLPAFMKPQKLSRPSSLAMTGGGAPPAGQPIPGFPMRRQELDNWCWAAVASGIDAVRGTQRSQCEIASAYADYATEPAIVAKLRAAPCCPSSPAVDTWGYLHEVLDLLGLSRLPIREIYSGDTTAADARTDLADDRPVGIRIDWGDGEGHFIALIGTQNRAGVLSFLVYDPAETKEDVGHLLTRSENDLAAGYEGIGTWSHVYFVH